MRFDSHSFSSSRSNVIAENGMVATSQPLAAQAGLAVLQDGGNAIDAAIATVATLCVVEPVMTGVGGDAFALIWWEDDQKLYGINASGPAPGNLTSEWVRQQGYRDQMPSLGPIPVTVPGAIRGWQLALERFGTLGLDRLLSQPIAYAEHGYPVSERIASDWSASTQKMSRHPDSRRVWLPDGHAPRAGERFRNPEFATTLQALVHDGYDAFYQGDIAHQIAETVQEAGGILTAQDLADYQAEWVDPISTPYRDGYVFHEIPPNGQGLTALLALNILRDFNLAQTAFGSADHLHPMIEAIKLAFADAHAYIADPRQVSVPTEALMSQTYALQRRQLLRPDAALAPVHGNPPAHGETVYLTVADRHGNMVSWIQSLYMGFGSGLTAGTTGIQLQNRGANFSLEPGHPNEVAPGKRPLHTIIPGFITHDGQAYASFGVMGGFMQPQGHVQVGVNLIDYGMDPQTALDAPRFRWLHDMVVGVEPGFSDATVRKLARYGHILRAGLSDGTYGGGQVIIRRPDTGIYVAGSEPRKDGCAVGW